jgi:hypothetical protein
LARTALNESCGKVFASGLFEPIEDAGTRKSGGALRIVHARDVGFGTDADGRA